MEKKQTEQTTKSSLLSVFRFLYQSLRFESIEAMIETLHNSLRMHQTEPENAASKRDCELIAHTAFAAFQEKLGFSWFRSLNWSNRSEGSCWRIWLVNWIIPPGRVNLQAEWNHRFKTPYHCSESCWSRSGVWFDHQIYLIRTATATINNSPTSIEMKKKDKHTLVECLERNTISHSSMNPSQWFRIDSRGFANQDPSKTTPSQASTFLLRFSACSTHRSRCDTTNHTICATRKATPVFHCPNKLTANQSRYW